jgi:hypothetical protein
VDLLMCVPTANIYKRSAWICDLLGTLVAISMFFCFHPDLRAQTSESQTAEEATKSWTAATDLKSDNLIPQRIPVRITESRSQNGHRSLDKRSVEIRGTDGHFEPYQEIERETLTVDDSTVKRTTRTFARDVNGMKSIVVTEEEKHTSPEGDANVVRITSNPDANGRLQPVQREIVETKRTGKDVEETNTTVMLTNINGGLAPAFKTHELRKRAANNTVEIEKTTWIPDINGKWQLSEIRQNVTTQNAGDRKIEERVFRPDEQGKLDQISREVSEESEGTPGEKRSVTETYSIDVPGSTRDGSLHLIERKVVTASSSSTGEQEMEQRVEQTNPGDPSAGLRLSLLIDGKMVPGNPEEQSTVTIRARDANGNFGIVSVDTTTADRVPTIRIQQTPAEQPK